MKTIPPKDSHDQSSLTRSQLAALLALSLLKDIEVQIEEDFRSEDNWEDWKKYNQRPPEKDFV